MRRAMLTTSMGDQRDGMRYGRTLDPLDGRDGGMDGEPVRAVVLAHRLDAAQLAQARERAVAAAKAKLQAQAGGATPPIVPPAPRSLLERVKADPVLYGALGLAGAAVAFAALRLVR